MRCLFRPAESISRKECIYVFQSVSYLSGLKYIHLPLYRNAITSFSSLSSITQPKDCISNDRTRNLRSQRVRPELYNLDLVVETCQPGVIAFETGVSVVQILACRS